MPQYIELTTDEELEGALEWLGRSYARESGIMYPMVPEWWGPGRQPDDVAVVAQRYYRTPVLKEDDDSGGVVLVDDTMLTWPPDAQTLDDGSSVALDLVQRKKPLLLLSVKARRAVNGVLADVPGGGKIRMAVTQRVRKRRKKT